MEISTLLDYFLKTDESNKLVVEVTGKRRCEVGLVVPAKFTAYTMNQRHAQVLDAELIKKEKFNYQDYYMNPVAKDMQQQNFNAIYRL